ncbi:MAG: HU family DNA-binding protein, partial [Rhodospirillaceae bacterium]
TRHLKTFPCDRNPPTMPASHGNRAESLRHDLKGELPMNKNEFVAVIAGKTGLSQAEAGRVVDAVLGTVTETLASGEDIHPVPVHYGEKA